MSRPVSMIVVQTNTSKSRSQNPCTVFFESVLVHLTVRDDDAGLRDEFADFLGCLVDRADTVVNVEDLTVAQKFTPDGRGNLLVRIRADVREG